MSFDRWEPVEVGKNKIKLMLADTLLRSAVEDQHESSTPADTAEPHSIECPIHSYEVHPSIGKELGDGKCGTVYQANLMFIKDLTDPNGQKIKWSGLPFLPSRLVLKVSEEENIVDLAREALNYMKLDMLQGASIPRFYGSFNSEVDNDWSFPGVNRKNRTRTHELSFMLIERTGDKITLKESDNDLIDIRDVLEDITFGGMKQCDVRPENIMKAPPVSLSGLPVRRCRRHKRTHKYWVIDLEHVYELGSNTRRSKKLAFKHYYDCLDEMYGRWYGRDIKFVAGAELPASDTEE